MKLAYKLISDMNDDKSKNKAKVLLHSDQDGILPKLWTYLRVEKDPEKYPGA